jgi:hypothetical protein
MVNNVVVQQMFFEQLRLSASANLSFVSTVAEVLEIKHDSAYRRIRGDTRLTVPEVDKLLRFFQMSSDEVIISNLQIRKMTIAHDVRCNSAI